MTNPIITIHNVDTNEITTREMNDDELAQWQTDQAANLVEKEAEAIKIAEKAALLNRLGITEEEAKLLLS